MNILVRKNNHERGPYTEAEVRERLKSGALSARDLGQIEGENEWKPLSEILLATVLASDKPAETPPVRPAGDTAYPWLRQPQIIGGAVLLLLLIFGGINWLNKASEKRREDAAAARQLAVMEKAQKQSDEMVRQQEERAAKTRQAQADQVKQLMAMSEKAQKDYQEKQKREQEERQKAEQAKIDAELRQQQQAGKQADERRLAAEAKQKAQEAEFLKNRPKPVATASNTKALTATPPAITLASMALGPIPKESEKIVFSDDRARVFVIASQGSRVQAIVDGVPGPLCRKLRWPWQHESVTATIYGATENHLVRWRDNIPVPGPPPFSPDKKRFAYIIELDNDKQAVVIDGTQSPVYDKIGWLAFGPNGHHVAYIGVQRGSSSKPGGRQAGMVTMVDNGKAGPIFDDIASAEYKTTLEEIDKESIAFSADGEHLAYVGTKQSPQRNHQRVVIDGRAEAREYEHIKELRISGNGQHLAYVETTYIRNNMGGGENESKVVLDGKEGPGFPQIEKLLLSENGSRCAYVTEDRSGDRAAVVDEGVKGPQFSLVSEIVVSENGQRVAYVGAAQKYGSQAVVVDNGKQSVPYDKCEFLKISADGTLLSFFADSSQGKLLVVNGQEFGPFYNVNNNLTYSADGKHWACSVEATSSNESRQFLIDGETRPVPKAARYTGFSAFEYRPDKGGWFAKGLNCELQIQTATEDTKIPSKIVYSRDGKHVAKIFPNTLEDTHSSEQVFVDDKPVGPPYLRVHDLQLSDDGKHVAFIGMYNGTMGTDLTHVNFDGLESPAWAEISDLAMTPDGSHIAYSVQQRGTGSNNAAHVVVDGFTGPNFDYQTSYNLASTKFNPDESLTFIASLKGQLARYTYPAEALKFMPTIGQTESVSAGVQTLQTFPQNDVSRHIVVTPDNFIYGTAAEGGEYGHGLFYRIKPDKSGWQIIHSFYGNQEDGGNPREVVLGQDGIIYGEAKSIIFRYDPAKSEYGIARKGDDDASYNANSLLGAFRDGSLLLADEGKWVVEEPGREEAEGIAPPAHATFVALGPDGAMYSVTDDSLLRQATVYSPPTVLHKFVDSPQDAKRPDQYITFDPTGVIYGSAKSGDERRSIVYRVNRDGTDYRVLLNQSQNFRVGSVVAGDDAALYGHFTHEKQSGLCRLSTQGGQPEFLDIKGDSGQFQDSAYANSMRPMVFHKSAVFHSTQDTLVKVQLPRTGEAARLSPVVTIRTVAALPLGSVDPFSFTASAGEALPTAKAPGSQPGATLWHPPQPGSTIAVVGTQSPPRVQNRLTRPGDDNTPTANFGSETGWGQGLSQQDATAFAMMNVNAMSAGDISTLTSFYATEVDYQDKRVISNDAVRNEFQDYFARWPQTTWQLAGPVTVQPLGPSRSQITFPVSFEAANPSTNKRSAGAARQTLVLEQDPSGAWKIVMERQTITSNKSNDRRRGPDSEKIYKGKRIDPRRPNIPLPPNIPWPPGLPRP